MGKCISHITRKDWYKNCNKGCMYCFGYNCDMCGSDMTEGWDKCVDVMCFFCSFSCCQCQCRFLSDCYQSLKNQIDPCFSACGRMGENCLKLCQNECDDMCECTCYCENPCIFRDTNNKQLQDYLSQFKIKVNFYNDPFFGDACILQHIASGMLYTVKLIEHHNENKFLQADQAFKRRKQIYHPNIVNLKHLETEIKFRRTTQNFFKEEDLWNLIEGTLQSLNFFQEIKLEHRSIRANRIYVTQLGIFKIADPYLFKSSVNYDDVKDAYFSSDAIPANVYLSPDQFNKLVNEEEYKVLNGYENRLKSDVYTLGMIILSAATLDNLHDIYNYEENSMNYKSIQDKIEQSMQRYRSASLGRLLHGMLELNQDVRFDAKRALMLLQSDDKVKQAIAHSRTHNAQPYIKRDNQTPFKHKSLGVINEMFFENESFHFQDFGNNSFEDRISNPLEVSPINATLNQSSNKMNNFHLMQSPSMKINTQQHNGIQNNLKSEQTNKNPFNINYNKFVDGKALDLAFSGVEGEDIIQLSDLGTIVVSQTQKTLLERLWHQCKESKLAQKMNCCKMKVQSPEQLLAEVKEGVLLNGNKEVIYEGLLYKQNIKHGQGKLYEENTIYTGNFNLGKKDGFGKISGNNNNQVIFEGHFVNDKKEGQGKEFSNLFDSDKNIHFQNFNKNWTSFEGTYKNNKKNGKGTYTYFNNHTFECNFVNNFADGEGRYLNEDQFVLFKAIYKRNKINKVIQNFSFNAQPQGLISPNHQKKQSVENQFAKQQQLQSHHSLLAADQIVEDQGRDTQINKNNVFFMKQTNTLLVNESFTK